MSVQMHLWCGNESAKRLGDTGQAGRQGHCRQCQSRVVCCMHSRTGQGRAGQGMAGQDRAFCNGVKHLFNSLYTEAFPPSCLEPWCDLEQEIMEGTHKGASHVLQLHLQMLQERER